MRSYQRRTVLISTILVVGFVFFSLGLGADSVRHAAAVETVNGTPLPDTGQTQSYTFTFGEDSDYLINPPSYTKLDANGDDLPDSATEWVMVRDNVTQLIWEVKTDDGSIHDKDNEYTWQNAQDVFIAAVNAEQFGGHSDWRMPSIKELASITDLGRHHPAINTDYFPNTVLSYYWSSTTSDYRTDYAWWVNFSYGSDYRSRKSRSIYVRAVRGGQSGSFDHFVINGDGTVTDTVTGLMWQQATDGSMNWEAAISHCEALSLAGYDDWRLPNRRELRSIVDYSRYNPAIDTAVFPGTVSFYYWSSTTGVGSMSGAWSVGFNDDGDDWSSKSDSNYVRAVRGGQARLLGHLVILSPRQGSCWELGDSMRITWDTQDIPGNVEISLSRQGGIAGTFETIATVTENDGRYDWTVTGSGSVNCVLRIEPTDHPAMEATEGLFAVTAITDYYVDHGGTCDGKSPCSPTISGAIESANSGTTIKVALGIYDEDVTLDEAKDFIVETGLDSTFTAVSGESKVRTMKIAKGSLTLNKGCLGIDGGSGTSGYTLADLEGTWYVRDIVTGKNGQPDNFGYETGTITFQSDGSFSITLTDDEGVSWTENGMASISGEGIVTVTANEVSFNLVMNSGKNVLAANYQTENAYNLNVVVKKATAYTLADLAGTWYARDIVTGKNGQPDNFGYETGTITFQSDGSFSITLTDDEGVSWTENGMASISGDGIVTVTANEVSFNLVMNSGKNVLAANYQTENAYNLNVVVKKATAYALGDIEGTWYLRSIMTQKDGQPDNFGYETGIFIIQSDGTLTGTVTNAEGSSWDESGTASISADGIVTAIMDDGDTFTMAMNAGKSVLIGNYQDDNEYGLHVFIKRANQ